MNKKNIAIAYVMLNYALTKLEDESDDKEIESYIFAIDRIIIKIEKKLDTDYPDISFLIEDLDKEATNYCDNILEDLGE
jgi:hypothetical protein